MSFETGARGAGVLQSEPFLYVPTGEAQEKVASGLGDGWGGGQSEVPKLQLEKMEREAFERGVQTGEGRANGTWEARLKTLLGGVPAAIGGFEKERTQYFNHVETEVVQLALAIARKILHREAQMDPLLLTGLVHVALEKLDVGTRVRLRAHPGDMHFWNEYFAEIDTGAIPPELIGDANLKAGECMLETEVGSTQISLDTQLKEIEQGFFDLLDQKPKAK